MFRIKNFLLLVLAISAITTSCKYNNEQEKPSRIIREEKPITKIDVTIDTSNAFNRMFIHSDTVNAYLTTMHLGDTLSNRIKSFYNSRNYQMAWFSPEGIPEHTLSFWNMLKNYINYSKDSTVYDKKLNDKMEGLIRADSLVIKNNALFRLLELELTRYFYLYADHAYAYDKNFDIKSLEAYIPRKKMTVEAMLDSALNKTGRYADNNAPTNPQYARLRNRLQQYQTIKEAGGWPTVKSKVEVMKQGYKDAAVKELRKRLQIEGFLQPGDDDSSTLYDLSLAKAVNALKHTYGYKQDGMAGKTFLKEVNIPVEERIQQILINMERMRWIPTETKDSNRAIMVNIPEYKLHVYENGKPAWDMDVVVGKEGNNTTVFTGKLSVVVFSPYWNVPAGIAKKEIKPKGIAYMNRNHYEWYNGGLIRQKPGPWNSLGLVKFLFPNSYNIYFHDSPAKSLFNRDKRSYSHGCIRLKEPAKLAHYLLNDTIKWSAAKVDSAMNSGKEKFVNIRPPLPVLITYFTSWVNDETLLNFREDVYGHDEIIAKKMFLNSRKTTRIKPDPPKPKTTPKHKDSVAKKTVDSVATKHP